MLIYGVGVKAYYDTLFKEKYYILDYFDSVIMQKFIDTMLFLDGKRSQNFEILTCRHINDLLAQLCLLNKETSDLAMSEAIAYVEENYTQKIAVDELAAVARISKYHFIRKFKNIYSETPYEFVNRYKINKAKEMLIMTEKTVDEISDELGYSDTTTFIRAFKRFSGATPNRYRGSIKK
jgi:AraC-like DNA-binding protein